MIRKLIKFYLNAGTFARIFTLLYVAFTASFTLSAVTYLSAALLAGFGVYVFVRDRLSRQRATDYLIFFGLEAAVLIFNLVYSVSKVFFTVKFYDLVLIGTVPGVIVALSAGFYIYKLIKKELRMSQNVAMAE